MTPEEEDYWFDMAQHVKDGVWTPTGEQLPQEVLDELEQAMSQNRLRIK